MSVDKFGHAWGSERDPYYRWKHSQPAANQIYFTRTGDYDTRNHRISNLKTAVEPTDAVNKKYIDEIKFGLIEKIKNLSDVVIDKKIVDKMTQNVDNINKLVNSRVDGNFKEILTL